MKKKLVILGFVCLVSTIAMGVYAGKFEPLSYRVHQWEWSIGIYSGESPLTLSSPPTLSNPVFTAKQVTDVPAEFVADPFLIQEGSTWYLFFEVLNARTQQGDIGFATSKDLAHWVYGGIVLDEAFHLSYPYVFQFDNTYYMIPESRQANAVRLYKAEHFPKQWVFVTTLIEGPYVDPSPFYYAGRWWMFVGANSPKNDTLRLYYAERLTGPWIEHPRSPIISGDGNIARPGGRVLVLEENRIIRFAQDSDPAYGNQLWAFEIVQLTPTAYVERPVSEVPILQASGSGWNAIGMHHADPHPIEGKRWIASVDGHRDKMVLRLGSWFPQRIRQEFRVIFR